MEKLKQRIQRFNNKNKVKSKTNFTFKEQIQSGEQSKDKEKAMNSVLEGIKTVSNFNKTFNESQKSKQQSPVARVVPGTHQFKYVEREKSQKVAQYYYPKDQDNWNNDAQRYYPNQELIMKKIV